MSTTPALWTVRKILEWTTAFFTRKQVDSPRLSAELLLGHILGVPRIKLYTDYERPLADGELAAYRGLVQRAAEQEPIAYLTGKAHFFNLEFEVTRQVLIPRPDTETLVENVLQQMRHQPGLEMPRVLDLCTGSGCVAAAIAHHLRNSVVVAVDISPAAVEVARGNIQKLGLDQRVTVLSGDLYDSLSTLVDVRPFDLIVANPPYIATAKLAKLDRNVREYEPIAALDGGSDGLALHRRILAGGAARLTARGQVFLEIAFDQAGAARELARGCEEFEDVRIIKDNAGNDRVLALRKRD